VLTQVYNRCNHTLIMHSAIKLNESSQQQSCLIAVIESKPVSDMVLRSINSLLMLVYMLQYMALLVIVVVMGLVAGFMTVALYWEVTVILSPIFTALHGMQSQYSDGNSVCPSVHLSVCLSVKRVHCDKMEETYV